jgi:mRNA interferase YafQ
LTKLSTIVERLALNQEIGNKHRPHKLSGNYAEKWECHIEPDWLLIYELSNDLVTLYRTGTHSDLFR